MFPAQAIAHVFLLHFFFVVVAGRDRRILGSWRYSFTILILLFDGDAWVEVFNAPQSIHAI